MPITTPTDARAADETARAAAEAEYQATNSAALARLRAELQSATTNVEAVSDEVEKARAEAEAAIKAVRTAIVEYPQLVAAAATSEFDLSADVEEALDKMNIAQTRVANFLESLVGAQTRWLVARRAFSNQMLSVLEREEDRTKSALEDIISRLGGRPAQSDAEKAEVAAAKDTLANATAKLDAKIEKAKAEEKFAAENLEAFESRLRSAQTSAFDTDVELRSEFSSAVDRVKEAQASISVGGESFSEESPAPAATRNSESRLRSASLAVPARGNKESQGSRRMSLPARPPIAPIAPQQRAAAPETPMAAILAAATGHQAQATALEGLPEAMGSMRTDSFSGAEDLATAMRATSSDTEVSVQQPPKKSWGQWLFDLLREFFRVLLGVKSHRKQQTPLANTIGAAEVRRTPVAPQVVLVASVSAGHDLAQEERREAVLLVGTSIRQQNSGR